MADQEYYTENNRFWIDLHKCATYEAVMIIETRIAECYKYGIDEIEVIYGTPDQYEGSIQQAMKELAKTNKKVDGDSEFHAGTKIKLVNNPNPHFQDDKMSFAGFSASYESHFKYHQFERDYYPCRNEFSTIEMSETLGCSVEYVRDVLYSLPSDSAESIREYNQYTKRNEQRWRIYKVGADMVQNQWQEDSSRIRKILQELGASVDEVGSIIASVKKPLDKEKSAESRLKGALTRLRNKRQK